jgi:dipeptidyl aminopeptidase/acylaminoacyl peptidase
MNPSAVSAFLLAGLLTVPFSMGTALAQEAGTADSRHLSVAHLSEMAAVSDPRVSPDNAWIAYTVSRDDLEEDESRSRIWMVRSTGGEPVALTAEDESSSRPRWSPDGRYLAFLSSRDDEPAQVWSLYRGGGEAVQLTDTAQSVRSYEWSPDSSRMLLILQDPSPEELAAKEAGDDYEEKTAPPWVIDRQQFKLDYEGYLDRRRTHVHLLDVKTGDVSQLTSGDYDDTQATWSPDGKFISFTSNRTEEPDSNYNTDIWIVDAGGGKEPQRITTNPGPDANPAWSPDGRYIAHTMVTNVDATLYATSHLAVSSVDGGGTRVLTTELDRMIFNPQYSLDGEQLWFLLEDSGEQNLARIAPDGGSIERLVKGRNIVRAFQMAADGSAAALISTPDHPAEVFRFAGGDLTQLSHANSKLLADLELGEVVKVNFNSRDGTGIEGFVIKPPGFEAGRRYPVILDIHGGPQSQYDYGFSFEDQLYAAHGYLVVRPNPRGSTGYGEAFCLGIWKDWGGPDYEDVMAAVDDVIERGWGDPERLGVTGWSYGGMLTNHIITKTDRFKAAATGASATLYVVNYGHDQYQRWWDQELGYPWDPETRKLYEELSPFNKLDKVVTPTLILGGEKDWNVPIINSEQLYLGLKKLGVETQLVVYPGEFHGISTPSYSLDLHQRYLDWFGAHLRTQ